ncbi:MAG: hypothetical protein RL291_256 [Pseudomonadota bacterium]|jgi:transcriptional regulator with XRE-family HTH domain
MPQRSATARSKTITFEVSAKVRALRDVGAILKGKSGSALMANAFGAELKKWRGVRHLSQLDLALASNVSARHIAFIETGRANPSRAMVLQLCTALDIPRRERNALLEKAGFASAYRARPLSDADLAPVRQAVAWTLERHEPFPAFAVDRHWVLVALNGPAARLLGTVGLGVGDSLLDAVAGGGALQSAIENYAEVASHMRTRLATEIRHLGGDPVLEAAIARFGSILPDTLKVEPTLMIPTVFRAAGQRLSLLSTIAQFGTVDDIAISELRIELLFPADEATRAVFMGA